MTPDIDVVDVEHAGRKEHMKIKLNCNRLIARLAPLVVIIAIAVSGLITGGTVIAAKEGIPSQTPPKCPVCGKDEVKDTDGVWYCRDHVVASTQK